MGQFEENRELELAQALALAEQADVLVARTESWLEESDRIVGTSILQAALISGVFGVFGVLTYLVFSFSWVGASGIIGFAVGCGWCLGERFKKRLKFPR